MPTHTHAPTRQRPSKPPRPVPGNRQTRAGKRIPDALSKTVPIWCAVVNRAIDLAHNKSDDWDIHLYTPPGVVSTQEHSQMVARLDEWATRLRVSQRMSLCTDFT